MNAKTPRTLDSEQQIEILHALLKIGAPPKTLKKGVRNHLMGCLMLEAGLRVGEVVKLKYSHLFFNRTPVKSILLTGDITKNHKERSVPVSERLLASMQDYFEGWIPTDLASFKSFCFYVKDPTTPLTTRQVENVIVSAGETAFGRRINPHMLRHTFASRLMRVTNMRTVQELLGHSYITSTQIYTHPNEDDKKTAIEKLAQSDQ